MQVVITGLKTTLSDDFKKLAEKKLLRFDRFFGGDVLADLKVIVEKNSECVEITIHHKGRVYRTESSSEDMNKSLDIALDLLFRKIEKNKTRLERSFRGAVFEVDDKEKIDYQNKEDAYSIIKTKTFAVKPMDVQEAILQMNMVGHHFFMFRNQETNEINVVYKRKNNTYGLLEPEC